MSTTPATNPGPLTRFHVDGWDPAYGSAMEDTGEMSTVTESTARVDPGVESAPEAWAPVPARAGVAWDPDTVVFVDGVRRIEARVWIPDDADTTTALGVAASYAAGAVCCCPDGGAHLLLAHQRRGLFTTDTAAGDVDTRAGSFRTHHVAADEAESPSVTLSAALQRELLALELLTAVNARAEVEAHGSSGDDLLVVDGPLRGRDHLPRALGFIKTHRAIYLPPDLNAVVAGLAAGERTPVFLMGTSWDRHAWYLRLPCRPGAPWAGVVRVECAANMPAAEAVRLANTSQVLLPKYASTEYKDTRAPQNLVPIAGLERQLRRRLGEQKVIYRALQVAASGP